jgi:hypothetical protein
MSKVKIRPQSSSTWVELIYVIHVYRGKTFFACAALTVVVQNSVPVARMDSATTSQQFIRQIAVLGVSAFVLAATVGGFRLGLLLMIAVSAGSSVATRHTNRGYTFSNV